MKRTAILFFSLLIITKENLFAQQAEKQMAFTHADTLRGTITPERAWWNVLRYDISVKPDYINKTIEGENIITYRAKDINEHTIQVDLQPPLMIDSIKYNRRSENAHFEILLKENDLRRDGNAYFFKVLTNYLTSEIHIYYHGKPREAVRPPWDGGWIFTKDSLGRPWMSVACQGLGASVWYPCKDIQSDEPDNGASLTITVPDTLIAVGNGRLKNKKINNDGTATYKWEVVNPINNYDIIPYIGKYANWNEVYKGEKGNLDCSFWVLDYNVEKAKPQFKQVDSMLKCFEYWMGPYPFYEDGYKLIQAPHLGMEHQSAVAYGNKFENGYLGNDLSGTGWGLKWDFIIVHESGHEWFGNNITTNDLADMWVHEGFTNYSETLYTTCQSGVEAGNEYCIGTRKRIRNDKPIIAHYGVNEEGSGDMYYKGGNMLHMIRQVINDDEKFRQIWRGLNKEFYHKTVTTKQIENYISEHAGVDFSKVFDQYLRTIKIPVLEYKTNATSVSFRYLNCVHGFNLPIKINIGKDEWIKPTEEWKTLNTGNNYDGKTFTINKNFYITAAKAQ
jgi:aminopeptidase N